MHQRIITVHAGGIHADPDHFRVSRDILCDAAFFREEEIHRSAIRQIQAHRLKMLCLIQAHHIIPVHHGNRLVTVLISF